MRCLNTSSTKHNDHEGVKMSTKIISKTCSKCYETKEVKDFVKNTLECKECRAIYSKIYRDNNKEKNKKRLKKYYENNKEKILEKCKDYYYKNSEKVLERTRNYSKKNRERDADKNKKYRENNKEKIADNIRKWHIANKEMIQKQRKLRHEKNKDEENRKNREYYNTENGKMKHIARTHKRRYLKSKARDGTLPHNIKHPLTKELQSLLELQNNKCFVCGCEISHALKNIHLDHHVPISKGGADSISNVVWLCAPCNLTKSDKMPDTLLLV